MQISIRLSIIAASVALMCQGAYAQTPLPQFADYNFQSCLTETANRNGWVSAEQVTALTCANRGITFIDGVQALPNLTDLDVSGNKLFNVFILGQMPNLQRLNLAGNVTLRGSDLGAVVAYLPNLTALNLNGINIGSINNLNGLINRINYQPLPLTELDLGNTRLTDAQNGKSLEFLRNMLTLKKLNVAGNGIDNPFALDFLPQLTDLDLSNNQLPFPGLFQLSNLTRLNLSGNKQIRVQDVGQIIYRNAGLTSLGLNGITIGNINNLGPLVDSRNGQPLNLTELDLGNTAIKDTSGNATLQFLQPFFNLRKLNLANNGISDAWVLGSMQQMEILDLSGNQLPTVSPLTGMRNLTRLNLSGNRSLRIDEVSNVIGANPGLNSIGLNGITITPYSNVLNLITSNYQQANNMQELDLGNTGLNNYQFGMLQAFMNLRSLNVANNGLGMDTNLQPLRNMAGLQVLDLSGNKLADAYAMFELRELTRLNLSGTAMRINDVRAILEQNPNLTSVSLNGIAINTLSDLGPLGTVSQPYNLTELDLGNTGVQRSSGGRGFYPLRQFPDLQKLNLAGNGVVDIDGVRELQNLTELDLSDNKLQFAPPGQQTQLTRLNLSGNPLVFAQELLYWINQNPGLTSLRLNGINIGSTSNLGGLINSRTGQPLNLTELDLGNTGLLDQYGQKNVSFLAQFGNLQSLNLAGNGLINLAGLGNVASLRDVDLSGNALLDIYPLMAARNLTRLNLSGNPALTIGQVRPLIDQSWGLTSLGLNGMALNDISALGPMFNPMTGLPYKLEELDLGNTRLNSYGNTNSFWIAQYPNLRRVNLAGNGLSNLQGFETLGNLVDLDVSANNLFDIQALFGLRNLNSINLSGNSSLPGWTVAPVLGQNPGLTRIGLNGINLGSLGNIGGFMSNGWQPLKLVELDIGNTQLQDIEGLNFLNNFPGITRLNVAGNGLHSIYGVRSLVNLENLDLSNNALPYVGEVFTMTTLKTLNLTGDTGLHCFELDAVANFLPNTLVTRPASCIN
jgi:Leucine rich repeat/Leucine Rich repeats (2 copies)